jgi:hypothetical protein
VILVDKPAEHLTAPDCSGPDRHRAAAVLACVSGTASARLVEWVAHTRAVIVEDDYDAEFRYQ